MATKRDLVEAHAFSRRRLVTAFISGAPGGREVEPSRPGRALIGGVALTVLVLAAAAVIGFLKPRPPAGWADRMGMVIAEDTGDQFLVQPDGGSSGDSLMVPIANTTTARLILGSDLDPVTVPQTEIDRYERGPEVGILGAPSSLPSQSLTIDTGWTACTGPGVGTRLLIDDDAPVTPTRDSVVVKAAGGLHLIAIGADDPAGRPRAFRYQLPRDDEQRNAVLLALGLSAGSTAPSVTSEWLGLLPAGSPLELGGFDVRGAGQPVDFLQSPAGTVRVGDVVVVGGRQVLVDVDGYQQLSEFASAVYRGLGGGTGEEPVEAAPVSGAGADFLDSSAPADWPAEIAAQVPDGEFCAVLDAFTDRAPNIALATLPQGDASAAEVRAGGSQVVVARGRGAVVRSGGFDSAFAQTAFFIDAQGARYELIGDAISLLGFDLEPPIVPDSWLAPLQCGVPLSQDEARRPLVNSTGQSDCAGIEPSAADGAAADASDASDDGGAGAR